MDHRNTLSNLSRHIADQLAVTACSITLLGRPIEASGAVAAALDDWQFVLGDGPTKQAYEGGDIVEHPSPHSLAAQFAEFAPFARAAGISAIAAFPMSHAAGGLGALTLYGASSRSLGRDERRQAASWAQQAAQQIALDTDAWTSPREHVTLDYDMAVGVVMSHHRVSPTEAGAMIRARCYSTSTALADLCAGIIRGTPLS